MDTIRLTNRREKIFKQWGERMVELRAKLRVLEQKEADNGNGWFCNQCDYFNLKTDKVCHRCMGLSNEL